MKIWKVNLEGRGYSGKLSYDYLFNYDLKKMLGIRNMFFINREDAEDFIRPIAERIYESFMKGMVDNKGDEEDDALCEKWKKRGFKEFRTDDLSEEEFKELYDGACGLEQADLTETLWIIPWEGNYDRIGATFCSVYSVNLYEELTDELRNYLPKEK